MTTQHGPRAVVQHAPPSHETRADFLPFALPEVGEDEIAAVVECLRSGWLTSGPRAEAFEAQFADYVGARHAVAVNSCTAALHLALEAVGVGPGDEVVTSAMTFTASAAVIEHLGARPVLADCDPDDLNLDIADLETRLTRRTRAILPVHFGGRACDMTRILELARERGLAVVEDAAHALPAFHRGRLVGSFGDVTCFSFYVTKPITTGEGGMAVTPRADLAERMRLMRLHGMTRDAWKRYRKDGSWAYDVVAAGYKSNLTDIAAALGAGQLRRSDAFHARRREIARRYTEAFAGIPGLRLPSMRDGDEHSWHLYVIQVDPAILAGGRNAFVAGLLGRNIGVSVHFRPLHELTHYRKRYGYRPGDFPNASRAGERVLSLPIYPRMSDADVNDVIDAVVAEALERRR